MRNLLQTVFIQQPVSRLSLSRALVLSPYTTLASALRSMRERSGCLFVGSDQLVEGIVTERDVVTRIGTPELHLESGLISSVMTPAPKSVKKSASIARAVQLMATGGCRYLLVNNGPGVTPSVFSTREVVEFLYRYIAQHIVSAPSADSENVVVRSGVEKFFEEGVSRLISGAAVTVGEETPLGKVLETFTLQEVGGVVVTKTNGGIAGIFTERDYLMKAALREHDKATPVSALMTRNPQTILQSGSVALAFSIMSQGGFRHLPVVDEVERLVGVISTRSLLDSLSTVIVSELAKRQSAETGSA